MNNVMNITKLSYSNLWSMRKMLVLSILIFIPIGALNNLILNMIIPLTVYNFTYQVMAYEDKDSIDTLISYLPVTKQEYILSRYILALTNLLIGIVFFTLGYMFILMLKKYSFIFGIQLDIINFGIQTTYLQQGALGVISATFAISALIPFLIKFGSIKGRYISTFVILIFLFGALLVQVDINNVIMQTLMSISNINLILFTILITIVVIAISYIFSKTMYKTKEVSS